MSPEPVEGASTPPRASSEEGDGGEEAPVARAAVALEGEVDLEKLVGLWPAVVEQVRESGSELLSHVFAAARPVAVNADEAVLEVGFPPSAAFNKRRAEAAEARDQFTDAVKAIVGERLKPVYVLLDSDDEQATGERRLTEEELIELMRTEFDAEEYSPEAEEENDVKEAEG
jgi:hypothetical protein